MFTDLIITLHGKFWKEDLERPGTPTFLSQPLPTGFICYHTRLLQAPGKYRVHKRHYPAGSVLRCSNVEKVGVPIYLPNLPSSICPPISRNTAHNALVINREFR